MAVKRAWYGMSLDEGMREYAALHGVDAEIEFESFRDHHLAKGSKFAEWTAAWRTWCRNAERYKREKQPPIGFTAPPRLSMELRQAQRQEEADRIIAMSQTPEQRAANIGRLREMIAKIGVKNGARS